MKPCTSKIILKNFILTRDHL